MHAISNLVEMYEKGRLSRRDLLLGLAGLIATRGVATAQPDRASIQVEGLNHVSLFVSDMERSVEFYQRLFALPVQSTQQNGVNLSVNSGRQFLGIYEVPSAAPRIDHVCVGVPGFDVDTVTAALRENGVEGRVRMRGDTPEVYFTDPDGISIQVQDVRYCGGTGTLGDGC